MSQAVIIDAVRTPVGTFAGALSQVRPDDLAALVLKALVERVQLDPALVEEVIMGCTNQAGEDNRNVARMALLLAGFPHSVGGVTVNRLCASGLDAIISAYRAIVAGEGDIYIAGGVESMTRAPYVLSKSETAFDRGAKIFDTSIGWRFPNPKMEALFPLEAMGETAENIYEQTHISRERQDAFALESQRRAVAAINAGRFKDEIVPVSIPQRKGEPVIVDTDEHPRMKWVSGGAGEPRTASAERQAGGAEGQGRYELATSMEVLAKLKPAFRAGGTVTAGNASGINDGAAAVLLMAEDRAAELGLKPLARIVAAASAGVDPQVMGYGPIPATRKALERAGLTAADLDLIELNEAFAVQALAVVDELGLPHERTNVNGGAIALGHPLGCSGARIMTTLVHELKRRQHEGKAISPYGLATMCVGVGQGVAVIVERVGK
ncbi:MAG: acetyl-CoA C-acyltransferase [Anaerolineales bacterium]|nr:acetyl-CoA C-acyltransferase [Anaerolineales bacterium]